MKPHFSEPEAREILADQKGRMDHLWLSGQIGTSTYLRSLFIQGIAPDDANRALKELQEFKDEQQRSCALRK
jgi:hypothetical protein